MARPETLVKASEHRKAIRPAFTGSQARGLYSSDHEQSGSPVADTLFTSSDGLAWQQVDGIPRNHRMERNHLLIGAA